MIERPKLTKEMIAAAAAKFGASNGWTDAEADELASVCSGAHMDGYELAKALDVNCGWIPTALDVEILDGFRDLLRDELRQACIAWARDNNIEPPMPVGTMTTKGEITGIYAHDGACYEIREPGDTNPTRRLIVRFEDARKAPAANE